MVITTSDLPATSRGELAATAPAATSSFTGSGLRSCTARKYPDFIRLAAIGWPMLPRPINPSFFILVLLGSFFYPQGLAYYGVRIAERLRNRGEAAGNGRSAGIYSGCLTLLDGFRLVLLRNTKSVNLRFDNQ